MRKSALLLVPLLLLPMTAAFSQSNEVIDDILEESGISYRNAAYLVLTVSGAIDETAAPEQAISDAAASAWGFEGKGGGDPVTVGEFSHMIMTALGIKGGVMYRILPGPRYAARELAFRGFIAGRPEPGRILPGEEAVKMLGTVVEWKEAGR